MEVPGPTTRLFSREEFAALVGLALEDVERWTELGLLDPDRSGGLDELDLLRWMAVRHYVAQDYTLERIAAEMASGELRPFLAEHLYPPSPRLGLERAAARGGVPVERVRQLRTALGFSRDTVLESDLRLLGAFKAMEAAGLPWEALVEGARVYGDALRRVAETETRLVHVHVHEQLMASGLTEDEVTRQIAGLMDAAVPLLDGLVEAIHHEHLVQSSIEDAYLHVPGGELSSERGSVETTIVFLDLESFTELTQTKGDQTAIETLMRLDDAVRTLALEHGGKLVKQIGDGLMLAFRRADAAAAFALAALRAVEHDPDMPPLHVGIHSGQAIYRGGDYIGTTVNLASRISGASAAGEILLSEAAAAELSETEAAEPVGVRMLRGAEAPLKLYRLKRRAQRTDPVCGALVADPPAAQLRQNGSEVWFCSQDCLRTFLAEPDTAPPSQPVAR